MFTWIFVEVQSNKMQFIIEWISLKHIFSTFFQNVSLASDIKLYLDYLITSFGVKSVII